MFKAECEPALFSRGYMGVEFFFLCSGIFMTRSAEKETDISISKDTACFIWKKIKGLMPNYYVAWVATFFISNIGVPLKLVVRNLVMSVWEILGLVQAGFTSYVINAPV